MARRRPERSPPRVFVAVAFGGVWLVGGVAVADWLTPTFDIGGFSAHVGTVAAVSAAAGLVNLPLHVARKMKQP